MDTPLTLTVTPQHLKDGWTLVYEFSLATGACLTVSLMTDTQADALPSETEYAEFVCKKAGNVLAREAPGCFAPNKRQATITFNAQGRVSHIA